MSTTDDTTTERRARRAEREALARQYSKPDLAERGHRWALENYGADYAGELGTITLVEAALEAVRLHDGLQDEPCDCEGCVVLRMGLKAAGDHHDDEALDIGAVELVPCDVCEGLEALCEECGGRGFRPHPLIVGELERARTNLDAAAEELERALEAEAEAIGRAEQVRRRLQKWARKAERIEALIDIAAAALVHVDR